MTQGVPVDVLAIHQELWDARKRNGTVQIYQKKFAAHLNLSQYHMSRVIRRMTEEGRIKKIAARYRNVGIYQVMDPADFGGKPTETGLN